MILEVDPKVDYAFKRLLGREETQPILIYVLNSVLNPAPGHRTRSVTLLNPFNPKETPDDKLSVLDVKARDEAGWQINVEMQMVAHENYEKRIVYYGSKFHQQQLHQGSDYIDLNPTISISFLNHVLFPQVPDYHLRFCLLEQSHHFPLTHDIEFHILELPKFTKTADELETDLDIWLYFLRHAEKMDTEALPPALTRHPMMQAVEELKVLAQNELERERYEARRKAQLDYNTDMRVSRMKGLAEGKIETIHLCERLLKQPQTPTDRLAALSLDELTRLADALQEQVLNQR